MVKVCIDAGHYGNYNRSPVMSSYYESVAMWRLHLFLESELKKRGIEVIKTREELSKDFNLVERGKKSKGCDLFLSLHSNACDTESVDHPAAYAMVNDTTTKADDISRDISRKLVDVVAKTMGTKQAGVVHQRKAESDRNGDGLFNDNYYGVLHGARLVGTPALILEHSFHTNLKATKWLSQNANLEKMAIAEADAIAEYFGVKTKPETLYRVQAGAFKNKANADAHLAKVKAAGFEAILVKGGEYYRVQVGAYSKQSNAVAMLKKITAAGFEAFVTQSAG